MAQQYGDGLQHDLRLREGLVWFFLFKCEKFIYIKIHIHKRVYVICVYSTSGEEYDQYLRSPCGSSPVTSS